MRWPRRFTGLPEGLASGLSGHDPVIRSFISPCRSRALVILVALAGLTLLQPASGQEKRKHHVPGMDKISSGGAHQMFSGKVQSLDLEHNRLTVSTVQGANVEIFPLNKGVRVISPDGERTKLETLGPGTNVLVSYEQKGDRRTVKEITVLKTETKENNKKSTPPS